MPTQVEGDLANVATGSCAVVPVAGMNFQRSVTAMDGGVYQEGLAASQRDSTMGRMGQRRASGFYSEMESTQSMRGGLYDGMALQDHILRQYYAQVSVFLWSTVS